MTAGLAADQVDASRLRCLPDTNGEDLCRVPLTRLRRLPSPLFLLEPGKDRFGEPPLLERRQLTHNEGCCRGEAVQAGLVDVEVTARPSTLGDDEADFAKHLQVMGDS